MICDELQYRIHMGDRDAFCQLFSQYGREVYLSALESLGDASAARDAAKQVFFRLQRELRQATGPIDVDTRIDLLTKAEVANTAAEQNAAAQPIRPWEPRNAARDDSSRPNDSQDADQAAPCCAPEPDDNQPPAPAMESSDAWIVSDEQMECALQQVAGVLVDTPPDTSDMEPGLEPETASASQKSASQDGEPSGADTVSTHLDAPSLPERDHPRPPAAPPKQKRHDRPDRRLTLLWILVAILGIVLLWLILGVLMDIWLLPPIDLGYRWFNEHIFRLFRLPWIGA